MREAMSRQAEHAACRCQSSKLNHCSQQLQLGPRYGRLLTELSAELSDWKGRKRGRAPKLGSFLFFLPPPTDAAGVPLAEEPRAVPES